MRKRFSKEIGGQTWHCVMYPATEGLSVFVRITRLLGAVLTKAFADGEMSIESILNKKADTALIASAVQELLQHLDEAQIIILVKDIVKYVSVDGDAVGPTFSTNDKGERVPETGKFDDIFAGRYAMLGQVVGWVLQENFADVFSSTSTGSVVALASEARQ